MSTSAAFAVEGCPTATVTVTNSDELTNALANATPGAVIELLAGIYDGNWQTVTPGTPAKPIWLCGGTDAVLSNDGYTGGYGLHLNGASYWHLFGFSVANAQKGVVVDAATGVTVEELNVHHIGDEAIHLRINSTHNVVTRNTIHDTGYRREKFGEGIYIGSSDANWEILTDGRPDRSDYNTISNNTIYATTAESVDAKEGTTGGLIAGNLFDGSAFTEEGADSWVDVKGNDWLVSGNKGINSRVDGFQSHHRDRSRDNLGEWGLRNTFRANIANVQGVGYGFFIHDPDVTNNIVTCDNQVSGAALGHANVACSLLEPRSAKYPMEARLTTRYANIRRYRKQRQEGNL
ncbi:right-handed parallel beta-helix repeat-containing protein [Actinomadura litoris]|uniref:right-handed parallel beta-helix repeat-containing protein n=1 Tax=Actinomadura litoris TaxID=2678616 RepID=UPI001FA7B5FE|nr:right-handed parallel beta-helix repeat-containing protein [Actinomadura litoris]